MPITTLDGAIAGQQAPRYIAKAATPTLVAGRTQSLWGLGGSPGAGAFDATLNGVVLSSTASMVAGQLPHVDPVSGNAHLMRVVMTASQAGTILLCDRLWHNGGYNITLTTAQNSTTPAWPARDVAASANGDAVLLGLEVSVATGAGVPTITVSYTNQAGVAGRTGTNSLAVTASATAGAFYTISLQAGDTGVRSVQSLTLSATWTSGTINLVAYRVLAALPAPISNVSTAIDALTGGFPRVHNGAAPFVILVPNGAAPTIVNGTYQETHG